MTSTEADATKAMLLEAVEMLPADIRPMVRVYVDRDALRAGDDVVALRVYRSELVCGSLVDDGWRSPGAEGSLRDVSAAALAVRLEDMIRRWLARP